MYIGITYIRAVGRRFCMKSFDTICSAMLPSDISLYIYTSTNPYMHTHVYELACYVLTGIHARVSLYVCLCVYTYVPRALRKHQ